MSDPLAYLNGQWLPQSEAALPLHDAGFVMGATVTDLCRTFHHTLYRWHDHLSRFRRSCHTTGIDPGLDEDDFTAIAEKLVAHNTLLLAAGQDLALVMFATPGAVGYYAGLPGGASDAEATFGMHTFVLPFARYRHLHEKGASLVVPRTRQVSMSSIDPHIKQRSRMHWWLAEREVRAANPEAQPLLLDQDGYVTETAAANFLIVNRGVVTSPHRSKVLEGISLQVIEELCAELRIPFEERSLTLADCQSADEAFLTSTSYCIAGVSRLQGKSLPWPGPVFNRLLEAWSGKVGVDIRGQILAK